jgi:voltage-gated potassium channel
VGYRLIEGWGWFDAFYMAVITVSSVGYMELYPMSPVGRSFTVGLIAMGVTGLGLWWGVVTALIIELDLGGLLRRRRMQSRLEHLRDHFIVCGGGRTGSAVMGEMGLAGRPFALVERDHSLIDLQLEQQPELLAVEGDATREHTLSEARITHAAGLASCLTEDADNLLLVMTARGMNPEITIVARAKDEESVDKLRRAGADHVISPEVTGGIRMAATLLRPTVVSFLDVATTGHDIDLRLEEAPVPPGSALAGKTLAEARIPQRTGLIVLALRPATGGAYRYNPGPESRLEAGDVMIVLGNTEQLQRLRTYVKA